MTEDGNSLECALRVVDLYEDAEGGYYRSGGYRANCGLHIRRAGMEVASG